ncbi:YaiI/YqxD family protein [Acetobacteraceae bacterium H6797]|nr:YaiI/YqxD family protein [Acetobacteraceae bacterium H6797]
MSEEKRSEIYVDGDACPVREEVFRVAFRLDVAVHVVSNGSRGIRLPDHPLIRRVLVAEGADAADDWIAEHITARDVCVTADIPLASRCLEKGARAIAPRGEPWTSNNIGTALAGREIGNYLRETGAMTRGPSPMAGGGKSRFASALDTMVQAALRGPEPQRASTRNIWDEI